MNKSAVIIPGEISREQNDDTIVCRVMLQPDDDCFKGHFPELPVLPGVVQAHWALQLAELLGFDPASFSGFPRVKFKLIARPPLEIEIFVERKTDVSFRFRVSSEGGLHSEGSFRSE